MQKKALENIAGKEDTSFQDLLLFFIFLFDFSNDCKDMQYFMCCLYFFSILFEKCT